ncbi:hypothetical protein DAT35_37530 [Vitiosangium sp. GDMCC 1.1324]|nr:hypothetical protein DAT35_37530 [Vitiosangium sp. GDMCC 1.1324]
MRTAWEIREELEARFVQRVARLAVPVLADWCGVDVLDERGQTHRLVVVHREPEKAPRRRGRWLGAEGRTLWSSSSQPVARGGRLVRGGPRAAAPGSPGRRHGGGQGPRSAHWYGRLSLTVKPGM